MKIVVGSDGSPAAIAAIAGLSAAGLPDRGEALVVSVCEMPARGSAVLGGSRESEWRQEHVATAVELASRGAALLRRTLPGWTAVPHVLTGSAASSLLEVCSKEKPDLLVVGAHGGSALAGFLLGSVAMKLATAAPCTVRLARPRLDERPPSLLLAHDGGEAGDALVAAVSRRSFPPGTRVKVVSVHEPLLEIGHNPATHAAMARYVEELDREDLARRLGSVRRAAEALVSARFDAIFGVAVGEPVRLLAEEARELSADTIFVGARGLGPIGRALFGSVSGGLALAAPCSVEIHREGAAAPPSTAPAELAAAAR